MCNMIYFPIFLTPISIIIPSIFSNWLSLIAFSGRDRELIALVLMFGLQAHNCFSVESVERVDDIYEYTKVATMLIFCSGAGSNKKVRHRAICI